LRQPHPLTPLCAALISALASNAYAADGKTAVELDTVSVTATRTETSLAKTPASVSVITEKDIAEQQPRDVKDLLRFEPGVTVSTAPYRPPSAAMGGGKGGNSSINIRGLDGNRVLLMEDGIRLPYGFSFGPQQSGRGDFVDMDELKRVEILRGAASTLYGSDGLTGAVNFITKDPQDYLKGDRNRYFSLKETYRSVDDSWSTTGTVAAGNEQWQGMLVGTWRNGHEQQTYGGNDSASAKREAANPQNARNDTFLAKLHYTPDAVNAFKLSAERRRGDVDTDVLSARSTSPAAAIKSLTDQDRLQHDRISVDYDYNDAASPWLQKAHLLVYAQHSQTDQHSLENRVVGTSRFRDNQYKENTVGGMAQAESGFATGELLHRMVYGIDASLAKISSLRQGGGSIPAPGETFPSKAFPDTDYRQSGAFVQDEIRLGALTVTPGLRYDSYSLKPKGGDPLFTGMPVEQSKSAVSPRLSAMVEFMPALSAYATYAKGFRAPTPDQVNNGFANRVYGYYTIGNPNLRPETSDTVEIGLKGKAFTPASRINYAVAAYQGRYKDFINQVTVGGTGAPNNPLVFQYVNNARADIHGVEGKLDWQFDNGIGLNAAAAYTHGTTRNDSGQDVPLNSVNPFTATLGLRYDADERWFTQAFATYRAAKKSGDVNLADYPSGTKAALLSGSSVVLDLIGGYRFNKYASVNAGVYNLTDRRYFEWSNLAGVPSNTPAPGAYTSPGRNVTVSLKLEY